MRTFELERENGPLPLERILIVESFAWRGHWVVDWERSLYQNAVRTASWKTYYMFATQLQPLWDAIGADLILL
jgi:hypothetical protein